MRILSGSWIMRVVAWKWSERFHNPARKASSESAQTAISSACMRHADLRQRGPGGSRISHQAFPQRSRAGLRCETVLRKDDPIARDRCGALRVRLCRGRFDKNGWQCSWCGFGHGIGVCNQSTRDMPPVFAWRWPGSREGCSGRPINPASMPSAGAVSLSDCRAAGDGV